MHLCCAPPLWFILLVVVIALVIYYARYMTSTHNTFKEMGIDTPPFNRLLGHFGVVCKMGLFDVQTLYYNKFKGKKVYGFYDTRTPILMIRDLDVARDIFVRHSNKFIDRRAILNPDPPMDHSLLFLKGEHWKRVRNAVSPTFTSGRLKRMFPHIQRNGKILIENLREKQERNEDLNLKDIISYFTLDVIASTGFGVEINSQKDPNDKLVTSIKEIVKPNLVGAVFMIFLRPVVKFLKKLNIYLYKKKSLDYVISFVDMALERRRQAEEAGKINDFLDLVVNAEKIFGEDSTVEDSGSSDHGKIAGLSKLEIQGQAITFIMAGMETVSTVTSFTFFLLANHPDVCQKVQEEIDRIIGKDLPSFDTVQDLHYLGMVISETMRLYPPAPFVDRVCNEEVIIEGICIPKGMAITVPFYAIHRDPDIWPEPEKFLPERFNPENKDQHDPYAYGPFGHGPRNCIGMRLGLLEVKMALALVLQKFTPVPCAKTVYPFKLKKFQLMPEGGLWVKMEARK